MPDRTPPLSQPEKHDLSPSRVISDDALGALENDPVFAEGLLFDTDCNEMRLGDGTLSPHWQGLITHLNRMGTRELDRRWLKARQIMHEHGAAFIPQII